MLGRALVVCPVDASSLLNRTAMLAVTLARLLGGGLHFLHVPRPLEEPLPEHVREWLSDPARDGAGIQAPTGDRLEHSG